MPRTLYVVSHGPYCFDGAAAAAAIARFYEGSELRVQFASNQDIGVILRSVEPAPGDELWITDISWNDPETEDHLRRLAERGVLLHWIDHHRTAIERLEGVFLAELKVPMEPQQRSATEPASFEDLLASENARR